MAKSPAFISITVFSVHLYPVQQLAGNLMKFTAAFRLLCPCECRDALGQLPKRGTARHPVVRVIVHQQLFHLAPLVLQQGAPLYQLFQFLIEIHVHLGSSLNLHGLLHKGVPAVQPFGQVGNRRHGSLRVQFVSLLGKSH